MLTVTYDSWKLTGYLLLKLARSWYGYMVGMANWHSVLILISALLPQRASRTDC